MPRHPSQHHDATDSSDKRSPPLALIVEDELLVANFLAIALEEMGFRVIETNTAADAIDKARAPDCFAVMFIDLGLPDRSGLELIAELQRAQPGVPIVVSTGYGAMVKQDIDEGDFSLHYLFKPYTIQRVAELLNKLGLQSAPVDDDVD